MSYICQAFIKFCQKFWWCLLFMPNAWQTQTHNLHLRIINLSNLSKTEKVIIWRNTLRHFWMTIGLRTTQSLSGLFWHIFVEEIAWLPHLNLSSIWFQHLSVLTAPDKWLKTSYRYHRCDSLSQTLKYDLYRLFYSSQSSNLTLIIHLQ